MKGDLRLWLKVFDGEFPAMVQRGFLAYNKIGKFMPKPGDIQEQIRIIRQSMQDDKPDTERQDREAIENFKRTHGGKTPTQVFLDENREWIRRMDMNLVSGSPEKNKKVLDQSRVLGCESK